MLAIALLGVATQREDHALLLPRSGPDMTVARPILNMGLPRSATTSVLDFFSCSGMKTSHYHCKMTTAGVKPLTNASKVAASCRSRDMCRCQIFGECDGTDFVAQPSERFPVHHPDHYCKIYGLCNSDPRNNLPEHLVPTGWKRKGLYSSQHDPTFCGNCVRDNILDEQAPLAGCGDFDVWAQLDGPWKEGNCFLPQLWALNRIHDAYPNATFVLPTRSPESWVESMSKGNGSEWLGPLRGFFRACNLPTCGPSCVNDDRQFASFYIEHTNTIRAFAAKYPSHKLIEIDSEDDGAGQELATATGLDAACWGEKKCRASCSFWDEVRSAASSEAAGAPGDKKASAPSAPSAPGNKFPAKLKAPKVSGEDIKAANEAAAREMTEANRAANEAAIEALPEDRDREVTYVGVKAPPFDVPGPS